ncbi:hypothetical protein QCA50_001946 [Cerrena zonata]|uniref:Uncharacterized protein n=1 Tax=Cerrena zonata TaxID=2478898 RepID=A0AAW0GW13_9APHY
MQISLGLLRPIQVLLFTTLFASQAWAANFTFTFSNPTQCDNFAVSWTGGTAPYTLTLTPVFGTPRIMNIPDSSFSNGKGTYETQLVFAKDKQFLATMSDASGFGTGGTSDVLKVGASVGNQNCNTTDPGVDFFFELNTALQQCRPFTFDNYVGAQQPITITGIIPGGQSFILNPPTGPTSFDWVADVAAGTSIMFVLTDSKGRKGGSSDIRPVSVSDDTTCLDSTSPTSASITPSPTGSQAASTGVTSPTSGADNTSSSHKVSGAVIAGAIAAVLFAIATIVVLVIFVMRRRKNEGHQRFGSIDLNDSPPGPIDLHNAPVINPYPMTPSTRSTTSPSQHNLLGNSTQYTQSDYPPTTMTSPSTYSASGYAAFGAQSNYGGAQSAYGGDRSYHGTSMYATTTGSHARNPSNARSAAPSSSNERTSMWGGTTMTAAERKAAAAGVPMNPNPVPARFILHTDLEDAVPPPPENEVIELPPQYSERRGPLPGFDEDGDAAASGSRRDEKSHDFGGPPSGNPPPGPSHS